jgi:hypothetical protein
MRVSKEQQAQTVRMADARTAFFAAITQHELSIAEAVSVLLETASMLTRNLTKAEVVKARSLAGTEEDGS